MSKSSPFVCFLLCTLFQVRVVSESDAPCNILKGDGKLNITAKSNVVYGCVMITVTFQSALTENKTYFACLKLECNCKECIQDTHGLNEVSFKLCEPGFKTYCILASHEDNEVYYLSAPFKLPDITRDENPSVIVIVLTVLGSVLLLVMLVVAFVIIWRRKVRNYPVNLKRKHGSSLGSTEDVEMQKVETLPSKAFSENKQVDRKRVLVVFQSESVTFTMKHFLSLLHKFPNLEVVTFADLYNQEHGILGSSRVAKSSDNLISQEQGGLKLSQFESVILILTGTLIDIWMSTEDYHDQTKCIMDKYLKALVALCHDLRRHDQVMTMAVNYIFSIEDTLKFKTFKAQNKGIQVFNIISYSSQLGFQLDIGAIHKMLQYLCDANYQSLLTWKESLDAELLLESIKKEERMECTLDSARERPCPVHGHLSEKDVWHINKLNVQCCERNKDDLIPQGYGQVIQSVQKKPTHEDGYSHVCLGIVSADVHQASLDDESVGFAKGGSAKANFDVKTFSLDEQCRPSSSYYQNNIVGVNIESRERDEVVHRHTHNKFQNEEKMRIPGYSGNGSHVTILKDSSFQALKDGAFLTQNFHGSDSCLEAIVEETTRNSVQSNDDHRADSGVYTSYIEPDEAALYPDVFVPPAELDDVYRATTVNELMDEMFLINKMS